MSSWPNKDPDDILDYEVDWSKWITAEVGDAIDEAASSFIVSSGSVVIESFDYDATAKTGTVWLSGGSALEVCEITSRLVTTLGRQKDKTTRLKIREA